MGDRKSLQQRIDWLLSGNDKHEALTWLKGSNSESDRGLAELTLEDSIELVERLYAAGAEEVWAVKFDRNAPYESINTLIMKLPTRSVARKTAFGVAAKLAIEQGFDPYEDDGQSHLYLWFD